MIVRFVYTKKNYMKYLGHLDLLRFFERIFRRLELPLAFSEGFNPRPKLRFGGPLSVGVASEYEIMEVELSGDVVIAQFITRFNAVSPKGIKLLDYRVIDKVQSLMHHLALAVYTVRLPLVEQMASYQLAERFANAPEIILRKRNKKRRWVDKDLKPLVAQIEALPNAEKDDYYRVAVYSTEQGSAKPKDIISILLADCPQFIADDIEINRTGLFFECSAGYRPLLEL